MLTSCQLDRIGVVLVSPRNPLNIGAAARAMANFGLRRLAVVAPHQPHWREAKSAVGAPELLAQARETATLEQAVSHCTLVIGTATLARRKPEQQVVSLPHLAPTVHRELERGGRIAFVFGSEKRGLTADDLAHCHLLVEIPTDSRQPSMNLGQAVAVCLYEIAARDDGRNPQSAASQTTESPATSADLDLLAEVIEAAMLAANYSPAIMRKANRRHLHLLLRRLDLTQRDARRILGLFRRILWRLQHQAGSSNHQGVSVPHK